MNAIALKAEKRLRIPFWGLAGAVAAFMIFLWPLLYLFREAFLNPDGGFTLANFTQVLTDPGFGKVILNSVFINSCATLLTTAFDPIQARVTI